MKKSYFAAMLAVGMFMFGAPALSLADEQPAVPADGLDFAGAKKSVKFNHSSHKTVECKTCALTMVIFPGADVESREVSVDIHLHTLPLGEGSHHFVPLVLHVMAVEVVGEFILHQQG